MDRDLLESAKSGKLRKGKRWLIAHLSGQKITRAKAVEAKCYDCDGMGDSGECYIEECPLLPFSPFRVAKRSISRAVAEKQAIVEEV